MTKKLFMQKFNLINSNPFSIKTKGWGYEKLYQLNPYVIKTLNYTKKTDSSGHLHLEKAETFIVLSGRFQLTTKDDNGNDISHVLGENDCVYLPKGTYHKLQCIEIGVILEVSTSDHEQDNIIIDAGASQREEKFE